MGSSSRNRTNPLQSSNPECQQLLRLFRRDLCDLVSDTETRHQPLLSENEGVDVVLSVLVAVVFARPSSTRTTLGPTPTSKPFALSSCARAVGFMKNIAQPYCWPPACNPNEAPVVCRQLRFPS